jgi:polysaccharide pyruvyl transferase WcaK-like protein
MFDDLKGYTHIFARESITYQALIDSGIKQTSLFPDPAFVLNRIDRPLPNGFLEKEVVGINVSPMVIERETCKGIIMRNYQRLVEYILETTTMNIVLIPHVVWRHNDDRKPLEQIFSQFQNSLRVVMIGDHSAEVLKGFIARCRYMVAARTHASIAAYSEQVPSLVVGYSVKAVGIAKDIFGTADHYVIPVQNFTRDDDLVDHFKWLVANENNIKKHLRAFMPVYKEKVKGMKDILMSL